jgi:diaminohydroxyphosphoribosylaminopyrimidine deaminase/5-amino-6-(5-phosphoribosylamino)uracil reductase
VSDDVAAAAAADAGYMARALELAARGLYTTDPNPRVGCVLVRAGRVVGEGWHARAGEPHAEVLALRAAGADAAGATAYVTLEPCSHTGRTPPCADALIAARIGAVHCATVDPNPKVSGGGLRRLETAGIPVVVGERAPAARALNPGFFSRFERQRPYVRLKLAMSLDGRTAYSGGAKAWVSGTESRADVQRLRARSSAVLTGAGTVRADDPRLDVRLEYGDWLRQPLRVVLDAELSCDASARVFGGPDALVFAAPEALGRQQGAALAPGVPGRRIEALARGDGGLDLAAVLARLAVLEVNELLVECGPRLAASFLRARLVDELVLYVAPTLLGADAAALTALTGLAPATIEADRFVFADICRLGEDLRLTLTPARVPS